MIKDSEQKSFPALSGHSNSPGLILLCAGLFVAFFLFIFSLPPVSLGFWSQSELAIAVFHLCGLTAGLGLFLIALGKNSALCRKILAHPFVVAPFVIALISFAFLPFQNLELRHFIGSTRTGQGIVWWLNWSVLIAAAMILCRLPFYRRLLISVAIFSFAVLFGLTMGQRFYPWIWVPYYFPDYLAFHVLALLPLLFVALRQRIEACWLWLILYLGAALLMYLTRNNIGLAFSVIGIGYFLVLWFRFPVQPSQKNRLSFLTIAFIPFLVFAFTAVVLNIPIEDGYYKFQDIPAINTIFSRAYLSGIVFEPLGVNPLSMLTGLGWGSYVEHVPLHVPLEWVDLTIKGDNQWDGLMTDHFHTHNIFIETFYSAGIFAAVVLFFWIISIPFFAKKSLRIVSFVFAAGLVSIWSFWFIFPVSIGFLVLALALLAKTAPVKFIGHLPKKVFAGALIFVMICQGAAAFIVYQTAQANDYYYIQDITIEEVQKNCPYTYQDFGAGGLHLATIMAKRLRVTTAMTQSVFESSNPQESIKELKTGIRRNNHLFCQSEIYMQKHTPSMRLRLGRLLVRGEILLGLDNFLDDETRDYYREGWREELAEWLTLAPKRTDQAIPYLLWHFLQGDEDEVLSMASAIYADNPEDPIGLWFQGLVLTASPETSQKGLRFMRMAIDRGIARFIPIEPELKAQLSQGL